MDIFGLLTMIGGLALFLYGMEVLGDGLKKASGGKLEIILEKLTSNKLLAVLLGAGVTAVIQSSSATTVMVVGFVSSGIMSLSRAVGVILGANVGTTITAWILSLTEMSGTGIIFELLKPTSFSPIFAMAGVAIHMSSKKEKHKNAATIMIGFAVLMFGMEMMSGAVKPLANVPEFRNLLLKFSNPILGMLVGLVFTAVIQSSSASIGVLQALCMSGAVSYATAIPIIMGQNIGTCVTAMISGAGSSRNAKRTALVHLYYNFMKVAFFMIPFYILNGCFNFSFMTDSASAVGVAVIHTAFNVIMLLIIFPFTSVLEKMVYMTLPLTEAEKEDSRKIQILDPIFLDRPALALEMCKNAAVDMAKHARDGMLLAMGLLTEYDEKKAQKVRELEDLVDRYEDELGSYLVKINGHHMSSKDSQEISILLHCIGDFERISDHSVNIMASAREMYEKDASFSKKAQEELVIFTQAVTDILDTAIKVFCDEDLNLAKKVEPMEENIDYLSEEMKKRHIKRLRKGKCTIEMGFVLSDITTNYERVSDHCSNIAICLLQINEDSFDTHEYQDVISSKDNTTYVEEVKRLREYYRLP
ncbi:MAG: Na/Pi cotransporter family protein [Lachnospiraceae bacterium]|nr:Na/Pi cotransporter family protein [Lachnospiraceae bacterium]